MNVLDLVSRVGGEFVSNKAQAVLGGEHVELAYLDGHNWLFTERGAALVADFVNADEEAAAPKTRKKAATAVESSETPVGITAEDKAPAAE